jgi:ATP-binding cassette subfamily F protein uup
MPLVTFREVTIGYRGPPLLDNVDCQIEPRQRIGLLGRNGAGKSTFLRLVAGEIEPDHGDVIRAAGVRVASLPQDVPRDLQGTIYEVVAGGVLHADGDDHAPWKAEQQVAQILSKMDLDGDARFETLSSGMKRRVLLAKALVCSPEILLLDEPTNHLDLDAITWLEDFLQRWDGTFIFVTHDRMFLRKLASRILEVDRGKLFDWSCDYDTFLRRKEESLAAEEKQNALFDKKLAQEEVWIRTGIKARRTRNEGRVRALEALRRVRSERRDQPGKARLAIQESQRSGVLVAEIENVSFSYGERAIFRDFSTTILRGDKIGVIGPNGAGKTTLLRVLLGQLSPTSGKVRMGSNLQIAYFDQLRLQLDEEATVQENAGDGYDQILVNGSPRHIIGYLQDFLFTPERARTPVKFLSGGERNRLLLAKLFAKPANVLVLDEPTNDLDAETLEMLEERLIEFTGTVLLVSHDREFLNNVVTSTIAFEQGQVAEYVGGYDDWVRQRSLPQSKNEPRSKSAEAATSSEKSRPAVEKKQKLSFKQRQELTELPRRIENVEAAIAELHDAMALPTFYQQPREQIAAAQANLQALETELANAYHRWEELEQLAD